MTDPAVAASTTGDDRRLVAAFLQTRSEDAFRALYRRHAAALHALLLRLTAGHAADAEDLAQEAWLRAVPALERFAWRASFRTWLTGIAVNVWRERRRAAGRAPLEMGTDADVATDGPWLHERMDLETAMRHLADGYRAVFILHDVEGRTHGEIADLLGIAPGTSKSQLARARAVLRRSLA